MRYVSRTCAGKSRGSSRLKRSKSSASEAGEAELLIRCLTALDQPRDQLPDGGPVLEAVARAAPDQPRVRGPRMTIDNEVLVGRLLVLADARLEQRCAFQSGESNPEIIARDLEGFGTRDSGLGSRIDDGSSGVVGDFESAPLVAGNAVHEPRAVIRPDRQRFLRETAVARRRPEEENFLPGWFHPLTNHIGEERAQPRAAGKHKAISRQPTAIRESHRGELAALRLHWCLHRDLALLAPFSGKRLEHGCARPPRGEIAAVFLQDRPADLFAVDLRIPARHLGALQLLERHVRVAQDRQRRLLVLVIALDQPQDADVVVELPVPAGLVFFPQRERARGHAGIDGARAVGRANDARLPARARAGVAGTPGVDERDARALAAQKQRGPAAERAGADDNTVLLLVHCDDTSECERRTRMNEGAARQHPRASRTARRTVSRSAARNSGPHGSSHASSGMTPSAASAHSMRRI